MAPVVELATSGVAMKNFFNRTPDELDRLYEEARTFFALVSWPGCTVVMVWKCRTAPSPGIHKTSSVSWIPEKTLDEVAFRAVEDGFFEGIPDAWTVRNR